MRTVAIHEFGATEVLEVLEVRDPVVNPSRGAASASWWPLPSQLRHPGRYVVELAEVPGFSTVDRTISSVARRHPSVFAARLVSCWP